jgi:hypothetical protein
MLAEQVFSALESLVDENRALQARVANTGLLSMLSVISHCPDNAVRAQVFVYLSISLSFSL